MDFLTAPQFIDKIFSSGIVPAIVVKKYGDTLSDHLHFGTDLLWSPDTHGFSMLPQCVALFEETRKEWANPITVDAGYRTYAHEKALESQGLKTAKFASPHSLASALDYKATAGTYDGTIAQGNTALRSAFKKAASALGLPAPRIGWKAYNGAFIHVDLMPMLFAPFTNLPHPKDWEDLSADMRGIYAITCVPGWSW